MPSWPAGVETATIRFGKGLTPDGEMTSATLQVDLLLNGTKAVTWIESSTPMMPFVVEHKATAGNGGTVPLPCVDQFGWKNDGQQPYTGWSYKLTETSYYGTKAGIPRVKIARPQVGQEFVDFDDIPDGSVSFPTTGPIAVVSSIAGKTGVITVEELAEALGQAGLGGMTDEELVEKLTSEGPVKEAQINQIEAVVGTALEGVSVSAGLDDIACFGDSLTESVGTNWPSIVASILGVDVFNGGKSGWASSDVATRQGALNPTFIADGNTLPATGSVALTLVAPLTSFRTTGGQSWGGTLAGRTGTLQHIVTTGTWRFDLTPAAEATPCPPASEFHATVGDAYRDRIQTFWVGRNNISTLNDAVRDIDLMVRHLTGTPKRYLVIGITNGQNEPLGSTAHTAIVAANQYLSRRHPGQFVDIRKWLIKYGLAAAGLPETTGDTADIAADLIPRSLMYDILHPNTEGFEVIGVKVADFIAAKGWVVGAIPALLAEGEDDDTDPDPDPEPEPTPTVLLSDSFARANTASGVLGATDSYAGGTSVTPELDAQLQIIDGKVGATSLSASRSARWNSGVIDHAVEVLIDASPYGQRLYTRYTDASNHYVAIIGADGNILINRRAAGNPTSIASAPAGTVPSTFAGKYKFAIKGATVKVYLAGALVLTFTDTAPLATGTKLGHGSPSTDASFRYHNLVGTDF